MVALYHRRQTGEGQLVDASLLASGVTFMQPFLAERHVTGRGRRQQGNAGFFSAPSDCYSVKDGWIVVAVIGGLGELGYSPVEIAEFRRLEVV